jgi:hypothetical protein
MATIPRRRLVHHAFGLASLMATSSVITAKSHRKKQEEEEEEEFILEKCFCQL